jgi:hypothetical protein
MSNYKGSEKALRKCRQIVFDCPEDKAEKLSRAMLYLKKRVLRDRQEEISHRQFRHWMYAAEL